MAGLQGLTVTLEKQVLVMMDVMLCTRGRPCGPVDCTVHGVLQARILEWVAAPFSRGSFEPRSPALQTDSLPAEP